MEKVKEVSSKLNRRRWFRINFGMHVVFDGSWLVGCCAWMQAEDVGVTSIWGTSFSEVVLLWKSRVGAAGASLASIFGRHFSERGQVLTLGVVSAAVLACDVLIDVRPVQSCRTSRISFSVAQTTVACSLQESQHVEIARSMRSYFSESKES